MGLIYWGEVFVSLFGDIGVGYREVLGRVSWLLVFWFLFFESGWVGVVVVVFLVGSLEEFFVIII